MLENLRRAVIVCFRPIRRLVLPVVHFRGLRVLSLFYMLAAGVGLISNIWNIYKNAYLVFLASLFSILILYSLFTFFIQANSLQVTDFWSSSKGARRWIRVKMLGKLAELERNKIKSITVVGVALSDVIYLFEELVDAVRSGITINVCIMDPNHRDLQKNGIIKSLEDPEEVERKVHRPAVKKLDDLYAIYRDINQDTASKFEEFGAEIKKKHFRDQAVFTKVCKNIWLLVGTMAKKQNSKVKSGAIKIYKLKRLPFARQWLFDSKVYIYSLYVGYPGVGVDNPVFGCSALDNNASEEIKRICSRAKINLDTFVKSLGTPVAHSPR